MYTYDKYNGKNWDVHKANPFGGHSQTFIFQFVSDYFTHLLGKHSYDAATVENFKTEYASILTGPGNFVEMYNMSTPDVENMIIE